MIDQRGDGHSQARFELSSLKVCVLNNTITAEILTLSFRSLCHMAINV